MLLQVLLVLASATTGGYTQHWDAFANWNYLPAYVKRDPTYLILAPKEIRPGQTYRLAVHILRVEDKAEPVHVRASVRREGVEVAAAYQKYYEGLPDTMLIKIPDGALPGPYALFVEGHIEGAIDESLFRNTTELRFEQRTMSIFVQFNIPMYAQGTTMYFRVIPVLPDYRPYLGTVDIYIMDPWGFEVRRWLSQQSNLGAISLDYELSGDALEGEWRVKVKAGGYTEYHNFTVVGFDLRPHKDKPRMETKLFAPSTILDTDDKVGVKVVALKMSNSLVEGRCWVRAYVRKLMPDGTPLVAENENLGEKALEVYDPMFTGVRTFDFWLHDLNELGDPLAGNEIVFDVTVQDPLLNDTLHAAAHSLVFNSTVRVRFLGGQPQIFKPNMPFKAYVSVLGVFNSTVRVRFLGGQPQIFKPNMPFKAYVAVAKQSGAPLDSYVNKVLRVRVAGSARQLPGLRDIYTIPNNGIVTIDFTPPEDATYLTLEAFYDPVENDPNYRQQYGYTQGFRRSGSAYSSSNPDAPDYQPQHPDEYTTTTTASPYEIVRPVSVQSGVSMTQLKLLRYYSPDKNFLSVTTSTSQPKVGEYIIFHVNSSFYLDDLSYLIASKGNILLVDHFRMTSRMKTFEVTLSPEMAPSARIVVWHIKSDGEIIADSMNYHVDATSRNNVSAAPWQRWTGEVAGVRAGVAAEGGGGKSSTICVSHLRFRPMIQDSMYGFDDHGNSSHQYRWSFPLQGEPDKKVYYPSNSYGVDANQTFLYAGLIAFTDANMTVTWEQCNVSAGWLRCADSRCYAAWTRCDGVNNCEDGTDESFCTYPHQVAALRRHSVSAFRVGVPCRRSVLMFYKGRRPYFLHIEAPDVINVGEQVGIRTSAFNFQTVEIEVLLILPKSPDYKFVKVGYHGTVEAHHPELSDREQQVLIWIPAKGGRKIYIPLVPQRMGAITVTMLGLTQMNTDTHEATFTVEPGGVIVHLHTPLVLDLTGSATNLLHLDINISETNIIPHQRDRLYISGSPTASISLVGKHALLFDFTLRHFLRLVELSPDNPSTRYSNVSLTAFVLITLTEVNDLTGVSTVCSHDMIYWGREVVPRTAIMLQNSIPYYGPRRWHKFDSLNVETTAYALMSYNLRNHWQTKHIVKWLNNQRNTDAGFISTQDTIVALEALYQFSIKSQNRHLYHFTALVEASSTSQWSTTLEVPRGEWSDMKVAQIPDAWGSVRVTASGTGLALLQLAVSYTIDVMRYYLPAFPVEAFQMDTKIIYYGFNYSTVDYDICARWVYTEESDRSGMAVIEADVPSGYVVHQMELDDLAENGNVRNLMRADFEGDRVVLYFDYMDTNPICVRFYAKRWYPVANMTQWHKVAIYDYYAPERGNVTMFEAFNLFILNICQVCGSYQCPYCPDYNGGATIGLSWMLVIVAVTTAVATAAKHSIWRP
ncbi:PREDICTED: CD109 antigen-like [Priapulus caudatus]|uniref:CD109 antigen-like n=1 Tax=Priapulus caudatus TaxID=37621 RepID=A0ABM1EPE5_PRICU|nr:PREDICTED: CD109 antigen-like [Priapulus caudatus]